MTDCGYYLNVCEEGLCMVCGNEVEWCDCEPCPVCGDYSDPQCYIDGHRELTPEVKESMDRAQRKLVENANRMMAEDDAAYRAYQEQIDAAEERAEEIAGEDSPWVAEWDWDI